MYQQVIIVGNLGNDPEIRYLDDDTAVCNFSVAANDRDKTTWFRVTAWRKTAEAVYQYMSKGRQVMVIGTLRSDPDTGGPRVYDRRDGSVGASFEVNANQVKFLSGGDSDGGGRNAYGAERERDEIPF